MVYPRNSAQYDFIICGGGTSGCVVAARLAEDPAIRVLVVEAGPEHANLENVHMVGGWSSILDGPLDWGIVSEKGSGINGRQVKLSRGKFLGGSSGCNGTACVRGSKHDFDDWGLDGWSGDEVFQYMCKAETFHSKPWFVPALTSHGFDGPLSTEPHDLAPISELVLQSMISRGLPLDHDMFSHGERSHGCGHAPRSTYKGYRSTAADFIIKKRSNNNITVLTETCVDKVLLEHDTSGKLRATGIRVITPDGTEATLFATSEVVVSAGTYCTPNILNRSGIGARKDLMALGIDTIVDIPAVGQNLMDHLIVFMFYETERPGLTTDHLIHHEDGFVKSYKTWKDTKSGFLASFPSGVFAFARLDERLKDSPLWSEAERQPGRDPMGLGPGQPHVEIWNTECYDGPRQFDCFPTNGQHIFGIIVELFAPQSRGIVALRSNDPLDLPKVDCEYLTNSLDVEVLAEACCFANEIVMKGQGTRDIVKGSWPPNQQQHLYTTREQWIPYVKENATTCYHAAGTCAMRPADDARGVVDEELLVRQVENLRVADCSVMPILPGGHTQMSAYAIGEKCADLIKSTWS